MRMEKAQAERTEATGGSVWLWRGVLLAALISWAGALLLLGLPAMERRLFITSYKWLLAGAGAALLAVLLLVMEVTAWTGAFARMARLAERGFGMLARLRWLN